MGREKPFREIGIDMIRQAVASGKVLEMRGMGTSMEPTLKDGSTLRVCAIEEICIGDIVMVLASSNQLVVHRVVHIEERSDGHFVYCQGDNAGLPDPPVLRGDVLARVLI